MIRGWCPTLEQPMLAKDGWLVRVRPTLGRLTAAMANALCDGAERWGSGRIELTSHANLQVRGLQDVAAFRRAITGTGLLSPIGRLIVSPLAGDDPDVLDGTLELAAEVETRLAREGVPHGKYTVVVNGGGVLALTDVKADAIFFPALSGSIEAVGRERRLTSSLGDRATSALGRRGTPPPGPLPQGEGEKSVGPIRYRGGEAFGFGVPFGALTTTQLRALATLCEHHADGTLRLTPWRSLLLGRRRGAIVTPAGIVTDPRDPLMQVSACIGVEGCAQATVFTRATATRLARPGLHVSGCPKGCAHPGPARLTLVGRDGRFDVVRHGAARDEPRRRGLSL